MGNEYCLHCGKPSYSWRYCLECQSTNFGKYSIIACPVTGQGDNRTIDDFKYHAGMPSSFGVKITKVVENHETLYDRLADAYEQYVFSELPEKRDKLFRILNELLTEKRKLK